MATQYRIYGNSGSGGPVDYASAPLYDGPDTTFAIADLAPGEWSFGVRAYDTVSGLMECNTDATVGVVIGADFADHTAVPNSPLGLTARATAGGGASLDFGYHAPGAAPPTSFAAWLWPADGVDWRLPPSATIPAQVGRGDVFLRLAMTLSGLADGVAYAVGVRALNAAGSDGNARTVALAGKATGPSAVVGLSGAPGYAPRP